MNVEHLKALVEDLLGDESQLKLQQHLEKFHKTIPTFVGQPQQPERQIEVAKALTILEKNVNDVIGRYAPAQRTHKDELRGRSEERSEGKECVRTCRLGGSRY